MGALVTTQQLAELLDADEVTVLDVRWRLLGPCARADYDEGHLPGAVFVDLDTDLSTPPGPRGRHPLPGADAFAKVMRRCGVCNDVPVVCYDFADGTSAARAWWLLRYFGHRQVSVLDGGYAAWVRDDRDVATDPVDVADGDFTASPGHMPLLDARDAEDIARTGVLLDARETARYTGERELVDPVAGHIPGAVSAPTLANVSATGEFLAPERLADRFEALGVDSGRPIGTYCGSGVTAAHQVLALELAGLRAALYADSWSGWITDPGRPVATGEAPG